MTHRKTQFSFTVALCLGSMLMLADVNDPPIFAQAPAGAPAAARQLGTVKSVSPDTITLATDAGQAVTVSVAADTKVLKLAAGSTDLKTAQPGQISDITIGDRVLATGKAGESPATLTAARVILMKSSDIAEKNAAEQAQWRTNGVAGVVTAVDPNGSLISLTAGTNKFTVTTGSQTVFKRFSADSEKYQDAKAGTFADIHAGDQLQARGQKSTDGLSVKADEVLSGSFKNLSGLIMTATPTAITLKDLATKKVMTVNITPNTNVRRLPAQMAQMFATRAQGGGRPPAGADPSGAARGAQGGGRGNYGGQGGEASGQGGGRRGGELSQMLNRFPTETVSELKKGDAVMVVASEAAPGASTVTAITLLTGVEPILTANPNGGMDLSGWSMGEAPGGGAEQ